MDSRLINIVLVGTAFMILFIAFQTTSLIAQSVLEGVKNETGFQGSGYISQAMSYFSFAIFNICAPIVVSIVGPTISMFFGAIAYFLYVMSYIYPMTWSYYLVSILLGIGAAFLWNGQGVYLSLNSDDSTISRNSGIFWALFQLSLIPGNTYVYLSLKTDIIDRSTRYSLFSIFSIVSALSLFLLGFLIFRSRMEQRRENSINNTETKKSTLINIGQTLKTSIKLLKTRNMLLLTITFIYMGLAPGFFMLVYSTCIGHYKKYGDTRKRLIGLHGILIGVGEILGGGLFGFITKPKTSSQQGLIVLIGFVLQIIYYYLTFLNIPFDASINETNAKPYIDFSPFTSQVITFIGSVMIGLGDSSLNTQVMNILASRYKETSASAFAIFKLIQALAVAATLFYAGFLNMQWQLLIIVIFLVFGTLTFLVVIFDDKTNELSTL